MAEIMLWRVKQDDKGDAAIQELVGSSTKERAANGAGCRTARMAW
jgi:hypothetical protein